MCGRFALNVSSEDLSRIFEVSEPEGWEPRFNIAPTQDVLGLRAAGEGAEKKPVKGSASVKADGIVKEWARFKWGLIPSWAKDPSIVNRMINARSETVTEKPSFRTAFAKRRCLVVASGFFEWERAGAVKVPHHIRVRGEKAFAMAGVWEAWHSPEGTSVESCAILTTGANAFMTKIHDRMPVILPRDRWAAWLGPTPREELTALLTPFAPEAMEEFVVSRAVNNPRNDTPACVEPEGT
jgi:putative SOS response-associated peptidase YedK